MALTAPNFSGTNAEDWFVVAVKVSLKICCVFCNTWPGAVWRVINRLVN